MKSVLVDTSIWINYFRNNSNSEALHYLFDSERIAINDVILAELIPAMNVFGKKEPIAMLKAIEKFPVFANWDELIEIQTLCLKNGVNGVGLSDLMIVQSAKEYNAIIFAHDKHFRLIKDALDIELFEFPSK